MHRLKTLGPNHVLVATVQYHLGKHFKSVKRFQAALELLERSQETRTAVFLNPKSPILKNMLKATNDQLQGCIYQLSDEGSTDCERAKRAQQSRQQKQSNRGRSRSQDLGAQAEQTASKQVASNLKIDVASFVPTNKR